MTRERHEGNTFCWNQWKLHNSSTASAWEYARKLRKLTRDATLNKVPYWLNTGQGIYSNQMQSEKLGLGFLILSKGPAVPLRTAIFFGGLYVYTMCIPISIRPHNSILVNANSLTQLFAILEGPITTWLVQRCGLWNLWNLIWVNENDSPTWIFPVSFERTSP